uniref:GDT1 family protein n=1 Tax=Clastoptera arizonana TaxID=38151 RepID=A0A1B6C6F9_9HEMI
MATKNIVGFFLKCILDIFRIKCVFLLILYSFLSCLLHFQVNAEKEPVDDSILQVQPTTMFELEESALKDFLHGFIATFSVIIVSEIGDKTFFIAAIMAMKHSRLTVFLGAISALTAMTIISVLFGWVATVIPQVYTYYISTALFALFGLKMLYEGYHMSSTEAQDEIEEVQSDLRRREDEANSRDAGSQPVNVQESPPNDEIVREAEPEIAEGSAKENTEVQTTVVEKMKIEKETLTTDIESGSRRKRQSILKAVSRIFIQAFTLTFLAEWGDRSQLTTIILAAREDIYGVMLGGIIGHSICTGIAVLGGRFVAQRISVRTVTIIGGVVFLIFAVSALFFKPLS